jgi:hypothetical protein
MRIICFFLTRFVSWYYIRFLWDLRREFKLFILGLFVGYRDCFQREKYDFAAFSFCSFKVLSCGFCVSCSLSRDAVICVLCNIRFRSKASPNYCADSNHSSTSAHQKNVNLGERASSEQITTNQYRKLYETRVMTVLFLRIGVLVRFTTRHIFWHLQFEKAWEILAEIVLG